MDADKLSAYQTLYEVLVDIAKLAAPIAPFFMERLWLDLVPAGADEADENRSVHYLPMPEYCEAVVDKDLEERMELAQRASSMVLALRRKVNIKVRQPLSKIVIPVISEQLRVRLEKVKPLIMAEVNVKDMEFISDTTGIITKKIKPNFKTLGKVYGKQMKEIAAAFATLSQSDIAALQNAENEGKVQEAPAPGEPRTGYSLKLASGEVVLCRGDYEISSEDMPGWLVASDGPLTLALDVTVTDDLRREGTARELINRIQNIRKDNGFEVTDRVTVDIYPLCAEDAAEVESSLPQFGDYVGSQTLAVAVRCHGCGEEADGASKVEWNDGEIAIKVVKQ